MAFLWLLYFACCSIRNVTVQVGAAVLRAAVAEGQAEGRGEVGAKELEEMSEVWKTLA